MRHRIKKIPTLKHLLHSDKDTYFYKNKVTLDGLRSHLFLGPLRAARPSLRPYERGVHRRQECGRFSHYVAPICVSNALLLVLSMLIFPVGMSGGGEKVYAAPAEIDFGSSRKVSLSILNDTGTELADDATVTTNIEEPGQVAYISNTIRINTNKIAKYYVGVQAADGSSNLLTGTKYKETIAGVSTETKSNVSPNEFGDNTWGYNLTSNTTATNNSLTYSTLPTYNANTTFQYTSDTNPTDGNHDLKLTFAAKINANKPADHYTTKAMVSVAADPKALFDGITTMQEMTSTICSNASENDSKQLKDVRDSKTYWITKLKDGNCWMTQNLDLDLNGLTIKPGDSNVESNWISTTGASTTSGYTSSDHRKAQYYDPGYKTFTNGSSQANANEALAKDTSGNETAHWLQGNLYSWVAATAGTTSGNASKDVCSKGWQLPTSNTTASKSFGGLTTAYSIGNNSAGSTTIRSKPLYFVYGGYVYNSSFSNAGSYGYYWSATAYDSVSSYSLYLTGDKANPSIFPNRSQGLSVRCVAK